MSLTRRELLRAQIAAALLMPSNRAWARAMMRSADDEGGGGDSDDENEIDGGDDNVGPKGNAGDKDHFTKEGESNNEAPGLDSLKPDHLQSQGTNSKSEKDKGHGDSDDSFVDSVIDAIKEFLSEVLSDGEKALETFARSLFVCVEGSNGVTSNGVCLTSNGNVYSTSGISGVPSASAYGGMASGDANNYINGGSISGSYGEGWTVGGGITTDGKTTAGTLGYGISGSPASVGYSEGNLEFNAVDKLGEAYRDFIDAGGRALQSMEGTLRGQADPYYQR